MIHYYINPKNKHLIIYDEEEDSIHIVKPISEGEAVGFEAEPEEEIARIRKTPKPQTTAQPTGKKQYCCSRCKKPRHRAKTCTQEAAAEPKRSGKPDEAIIQRIRELYDEGKTMKEIRTATGLSYSQIARYRKFTVEPYDADDDDLEPDDGADDEDNF